MSDLSIVVVAYGAPHYLQRCLEAVAGGRHEVIVVDNGTGNLSSRDLRPSWPSVRFIDPGGNRGFGAAANIGVRAASGDVVLLLNGDAWPLGDGIERLCAEAEKHPRGAVFGPRIVSPDGAPRRSVFAAPGGPASLAVWAASPHAVSAGYAALQRIRPSRTRADASSRDGSVEIAREREYVQGSVLLLRREALTEVGGFDERFFMFSEEADLCLRVRRAGWRVLYVPAATFVHVGGASTALEPERMYRELLTSHLRLLAKRRGPAAAERARRMLVVALALRSIAPSRRRRCRAVAGWLRTAPAARLLETDD